MQVPTNTAEHHLLAPESKQASFQSWLLGWPITTIAALVCAFLFVGWLPNYLNWPWYSDHDHFAITAQLWDAGKLPYRDVFSFQFPGEIYLFWAIGKLFGWGNAAAFYAVDSTTVLAFGCLLALWSQRQFGRMLPGLIGFSFFLYYYSNQNFRVAGQREWHSAFLGMLALLCPVLMRGRGGRILAGIAMGVALLFRPQSIFFAPGIFVTLDMGARQPGESWKATIIGVIEFAVVVAISVAAGFLPLLQAGVMDAFLASLQQMNSSASNYRAGGKLEPIHRLYRLVVTFPALLLFPVLIFLLKRQTAESNRAGLAVIVAIPFVCLYSLISPRDHTYFQIPLASILALAMACLTGLILEMKESPTLSLVAMILCLMSACPHLPFHNLLKTPNDVAFTFNNPQMMRLKASIRNLRQRTLSTNPPTGFVDNYDWNDVHDTIVYLRDEIPPEVPIDNLLLDTYSGITSMSGHLAGLPADNYGMLLSEQWAERSRKAVEQSISAVVVWNPRNMTIVAPSFAAVEATIRKFYEPSKRFGKIEVWSRKPTT